MCQSLAVGFEARCFILCKMGDGYNTYQRAELRVSHWLVGVPSPYLRQKAFEGHWGRVSDIQGVVMGCGGHYGGLDCGVS